jgi:hypothetical protein
MTEPGPPPAGATDPDDFYLNDWARQLGVGNQLEELRRGDN